MTMGSTAFTIMILGAMVLVALAPVILLVLFFRDRQKRQLW